jgi:hypothetical protein
LADTGVPYLIPGTPVATAFPLARYQSPRFSGVIRAILETTTQPGDLVLAVGTGAGLPIAEAVASGRRIIALSRNPIHLLWAQLELHPVPIAPVQSALTQLSDLRKAGEPLISHINRAYASRCPRCETLGTAEWFAWERESGRPFAKRVRCRRCGTAHEGPVDAQDLAAAGTFPAHSGPAYHLALSRAVPPDDPDRERAAELVQLYTPRNLAALMDIISRLPQLHLPPDVDRVLTALILEALDGGSSLVPYGMPAERPRRLRPPQRFIEANVWMALERAVEAYAHNRDLIPVELGSDVEKAAAPSLAALLASPEPAYLLLNSSLQELDQDRLQDEVKVVIFEVRSPEATFWALSILWAAWLWGPDLPAGLRGFLSRRRLDWEWYRKSLTAALYRLAPLARRGAPILMITGSAETAPVRAVVHSAQQCGLEVYRWIACPPSGYRLLLRPATTEAGAKSALTEARHPYGVAEAVFQRVLRERGEPTDQRVLEGIAAIETETPDLPELDVRTSSELTTIAEPYVWFSTSRKAETPLADRVETQMIDLLAGEARWQPDELIGALYAQFRGLHSPDPELVISCMNAYTLPDEPGTLALRPEDEPNRRKSELQQMRAQVSELGERLGYDVGRRLGGDIVWRDAQRRPYLFRCTTTAILGPHLLKSPPPCDGLRCLIVPGGRAALIALKLRRDARLRLAVQEHHWTFVKFRHLRRMIDEIRDRSGLEVFLGLDPMVEQESAQLSLPLQMEQRRRP